MPGPDAAARTCEHWAMLVVGQLRPLGRCPWRERRISGAGEARRGRTLQNRAVVWTKLLRPFRVARAEASRRGGPQLTLQWAPQASAANVKQKSRVEAGNKTPCGCPFIPRGSATEERDHGYPNCSAESHSAGNVNSSPAYLRSKPTRRNPHFRRSVAHPYCYCCGSPGRRMRGHCQTDPQQSKRSRAGSLEQRSGPAVS